MISTVSPQTQRNNSVMATKENVNEFFTFYLSQTKLDGLIRIAFRRVDKKNSLYYGIVLKKDNHSIRSSVMEFLILYQYLPIAQSIPVYFQFMPEDFVKSYKEIELIP